MLNKVMVIGNLGADPEARYTANGTMVCEFRVAANDRYTDRSGQTRTRAEWFRVIAYEKLAEICSQYLQKGRTVYVEGRLQTRSWDGHDGAKHYVTEVIANTVQFLGSAGERAPTEQYEAGMPVGAAGEGLTDEEVAQLPW